MNWKNKITKLTKQVGTYRPAFEPTIAILADLLTKRDEAEAYYQAEGSIPIYEHANHSVTTHPALKLVIDLESAALPYMRDLGLTPAGLLKVKGDKGEAPKECQLDDLRSRFKVG